MDSQRIKELRKLLNEYNYNYYVLDAPTVTDYEDVYKRQGHGFDTRGNYSG